MKILLFGGSGQLGQEFIVRAKDLNFEVVYPSLHELDITDKKQVSNFTKVVKPDAIFNFAAYTAVDNAETDQELCYAINNDGARNIAIASVEQNAKIIHISTDYVFLGDASSPLTEEDPTEPKSIYGKSKLAGEHSVLEVTDGKAAIIRTSSLHGMYGNNFVHTMLKLFDEKKPVSVVSDQIMSPCWAGFLAEALLDIARIEFSGVLHVACAGVISWYDFAKAITRYAYSAEINPEISATSLQNFARPAPRPKYSAFDLTKFEKVLGRKPIPWELGLKSHLRDIKRLVNKRM